MDAAVGAFPIDTETFVLGGFAFELERVDPDAALDVLIAEDADLERRNPYFGKVWPASLALAERLLDERALDGIHVLDLGCGAGLLGLLCMRLGAAVTFADLMPEGVELARRNAARHGLVGGRFLELDLRDPSRDAGRFDLVIGSDLVYEPHLPDAVLEALDRLLAPDGRALLADPSRPSARGFAERARAAGFAVVESERSAAGEERPIRIYELSR